MSLPGLPRIQIGLSAFTPAQKMALEQLFLIIKKNDDTLNSLILQSGVLTLPSNLAVRTDVSGNLAVSPTTATELGYVSGVTSPIQTQLNTKAPLASPALSGTPTAPTATPLTNDTQIATTAYCDAAVAAGGNSAFHGSIAGLVPSNDGATPATIMDFTAGEALSDDFSTILTIGAFTKTTASWAVGTGNGGLDTGAIGTNSYHFWVIGGPTVTTDILISLSATTPTMPTGYIVKRRIGSWNYLVAPTWQLCNAYEMTGGGLRVELLTPIQNFTTTNPGTSTVTWTISAPIGVKVLTECAFGVHITANVSNINILIRSADATDVAPSGTLRDLFLESTASSGYIQATSIRRMTDTSARVYYRLDVSPATLVTEGYTTGWEDFRRA